MKRRRMPIRVLRPLVLTALMLVCSRGVSAQKSPASGPADASQLQTVVDGIQSNLDRGLRARGVLEARDDWRESKRREAIVLAAEQTIREVRQRLDAARAEEDAAWLEALAGEAEAAVSALEELSSILSSGAGEGPLASRREALQSRIGEWRSWASLFERRWRETFRRYNANTLRRTQPALYRELMANRAMYDRYSGRVAGCPGSVGAPLETLEKYEQCEGVVSAALDAMRYASSPPSNTLLQAAALHTSGDYAGVVRLLGTYNTPNEREDAQRRLLLAAAEYALFQLEGGRSLERRNRALNYARAVRSRFRSIGPDIETFSPRFVLFFESASRR